MAKLHQNHQIHKDAEALIAIRRMNSIATLFVVLIELKRMNIRQQYNLKIKTRLVLNIEPPSFRTIACESSHVPTVVVGLFAAVEAMIYRAQSKMTRDPLQKVLEDAPVSFNVELLFWLQKVEVLQCLLYCMYELHSFFVGLVSFSLSNEQILVIPLQ